MKTQSPAVTIVSGIIGFLICMVIYGAMQRPSSLSSSTRPTVVPILPSAQADTWRSDYLTFMAANYRCCVSDMRVGNMPRLVVVVLAGDLALGADVVHQSMANGIMANAQLKVGVCVQQIWFEDTKGKRLDTYDNKNCPQ